MVLNPKELLCLQDAAIKACRKRKGDHLASIRSTLSVPFTPDELVISIRPHDLAILTVSRQHILDCLAGSRKKNTLDLYRDPQATASADSEVAEQLQDEPHQLDDLLGIASMSEEEDVRDVRQVNRTLGKRTRIPVMFGGENRPRTRHADGDYDRGRGAFRPSSTQQRVSSTVLQPRFQGKSARYVLERMQQSGNAPFRRLPLVCHGLWEFGFLARGLTLMQCRTSDLWDQVDAQDANISYIDFSERNTLRPAPAATSRAEVSSALRNLSVFAQEFYAEEVTSLIDSATAFVDRYRAFADTDATGWKLMAFLITSKFGKFRSHVVARDLESAQGVQHEFSRVDEELLELMDLRHSQRGVETPVHRGQHHQDLTRRGDRHRRQSTVPAAVYAALPRQGDKKLCMKWISVLGCSGSGHGGCFDSKRAHFRPKELPDIVKAHIMEKFKGLAPDTKEE